VIALAGVVVAAIVAVLAIALARGDEQPTISVYPDHRVVAASPTTTILFRGAAPGELGDVTVTGSDSGPHQGGLTPSPDGKGALWKADKPFTAGEKVSVDTGRPVAGVDGDTTTFEIADENEPPPLPYDKPPQLSDKGVDHFASRPDLKPPGVAIDISKEGASEGDVFVAPKRGKTQQGPMIVDSTGQLVWFDPLPGSEQAFDFRAQEYQGKPVLTWWQGRVAIYRGNGTGRIVDTSYKPVATVRAANGYKLDAHEFQLTPRGTALVVAYYPVPWDLSDQGGRSDGLVEDNVVQEIDVATGQPLFEWHALGSIPFEESIRKAPKKKGQIHDPFHLNSVALDSDGNFIVSARHTSTVYKIDRATGDILWRLGGKESTFKQDEDAEFALQHDARPGPDGTLTLFDNVAEDLPARGRSSHGLVLRLDEADKTATTVRRYEHPEKILSTTQGSVQTLPDGHVFIGWGGMQPYFTEYDADGNALWDGRFTAPPVESYRAYRMPWSADAPGKPAVAATSKGGHTTVAVSWNGATEVASWRVTADGGTPRTADRTGFETKIRLPGAARSVKVDALDGSGTVLGRSGAVSVGSG
jgi:Arylsulfotransferase (ASST)